MYFMPKTPSLELKVLWRSAVINPLTLQPEQSCGLGSRRGRTSPLERHDKGSRT